MFGYTSTGGNGLYTALSSSGIVQQRQVLPLSLEGTKAWGSQAGAEQFLCTSLLVVVETIYGSTVDLWIPEIKSGQSRRSSWLSAVITVTNVNSTTTMDGCDRGCKLEVSTSSIFR